MKKIKIFILQLLVSILFVLVILIGTRKSNSFKTIVHKKLYENNISFGYLNALYTKYFGGIIPFKLDTVKPVFNEKLAYKNKNIYMDGCVLDVDNNYLVPSLEPGLVIFIGEKENYGKVIIVESESGVEMWYGNINNESVKLYDYINKGTYLGDTKDDKLYLIFKKDGNNLNYEDYIK